MSIFTVILYGLVQGLTEFLPISSSAHLALIPKVTGIADPGAGFDFMAHIGTALAVILYFRKKITTYLSCLPQLLTANPLPEHYFVRNFCLSTGITFALALLIKMLFSTYLRNTQLIAFCLIFFGLLLYLADHFGPRADEQQFMSEKIDWRRSLIIGVFQAFSIFPGVSRSGITITASRFLGLSRKEASEYSFLLSLPLILAAIIYHLKDLNALHFSSALFPYLLAVILISFFVSFLSIHFFLKFLIKVNFLYFFVYRLVLGILLLAVLS